VDLGGPKEPLIRWGSRSHMHRGSFDSENVICTANGWLKEQDQQFFYSGIELWRTAGLSALQLQLAGNYVEK